MKKKRLLVFHPTIAPYRIDLFNGLNKIGDTKICLFYRNLKSQKFDDYDNRISKTLDFSPDYLNEFSFKGRSITRGVWRAIRKFTPDVIIVPEFGVCTLQVMLYKTLFRKKFKVISICDDSFNMVNDNNDFSKAHRKMRKYIVPKLDNLILVEPKIVEWYRKNFGKGVFFPIIKPYSRAALEYEQAIPISKRYIKDYHLSDVDYIYLYVGRLVGLKNVSMIIDAFHQLNDPRSALVIVGDGPERPILEREAAKNGCSQIFFTGRLEGDDLNAWYNIANCFILASTLEPFGAVTNEALLGGCYALVSSRAGSSCLVKDGVNGYVFDPLNTDELVVDMQTVKKLPHNKFYGVVRDDKNIYQFNDLFGKLTDSIIK